MGKASVAFSSAATGWKPRRKGEVFCSPRCGGGCTYVAYQKARIEGVALAKKMGPGWDCIFWENLGWHYKAVKGVVEVYPIIKGSALTDGWKVIGYHCFINSAHQYIGEGKSANLALARALSAATKATDKIMRDIGVAGNG